MKNEKQTIEEAAAEYVYKCSNIPGSNKKYDVSLHTAYMMGATSPEAKEFWQQGMFSEEDMRNYVTFYIKHQGKGELEYLGRDLLKVWKEKNGKS